MKNPDTTKPFRVTPEDIKVLGPDQIFVFGSNLSGIHGKGAALLAHRSFGAKWGKGIGLAGATYAIPTKDKVLAVLPLDQIAWHVKVFIEFAAKHPKQHFWVTPIGCGLAGYKPKDIAPMFYEDTLTDNISLPAPFITAMADIVLQK